MPRARLSRLIMVPVLGPAGRRGGWANESRHDISLGSADFIRTGSYTLEMI